ncbi:MAG: dihydropteroate synthase [Gammaproteobacteria bacterium]|nr:dihydropteroate synthase [Gammaproteobacteria bacterium]
MPLDFTYPQIMGILNVTPDSFSDGGCYVAPEIAVERALAMVEEGADIIDIGGESTRPGAQPVTVVDEIARVVPVIKAIRQHSNVPISVDTSKPAVMRAAVAAGASMINDVRALQEEGALAAAAELNVPVCLMHMQGEPRTMQADPHYDDVVAEVFHFLEQRINAALAAGIARHHLLIDPGFGFGKTLAHNLLLLKELNRFKALGVPLLVGISRKAMIGQILGKPVEQRLYGSLAAAVLALSQGADILRVHDVAATVDVLRVWRAVSMV